jgi:hypothetical protein
MASDGKIPQHVLEQLEQAEQLKLSGKHADALVILERLLLDDPANVSALEEVADNELSLEKFDPRRSRRARPSPSTSAATPATTSSGSSARTGSSGTRR